jgi:nitrile hydratase
MVVQSMPRVHDRGGWPDSGPIDWSEPEHTIWEKRTDALVALLGAQRLVSTDELRRAIESIEPPRYARLRYYERWITGLETLLVEKGVLTKAEIDRKAAELKAQRGGKIGQRA